MTAADAGYLLNTACQVHYALQFWQLEDFQVVSKDSGVWDHYVACSFG